MATPEVYFYQESEYQTLSHSLRVFICGVDVSSWLRGSLSVTYGDRESFNSCSFEITNPRRLWQITRDNIEGKWNISGGEVSELLKREVFIYKNDRERNPYFKMDVEAQELGRVDLNRPAVGAAGNLLNRDASLYPANDGEERRWRLSVLDCIFNKHDFLRIFTKNPYTSSDEQWMESFCGFVQDISISNNFLTGESSVRINGSCIKQQLHKMRTTANPYAELINQDAAPLFKTGFYQDFLTPGIGSHPFAIASLETTIKALVVGLGTVTDDLGNKQGTSSQKGIGGFQLGNVMCYDPGAPGNLLERWHLMTLFGVNKVGFPKGGNQDNLWLSTADVNTIGAATRTDRNLPVGGPDSRYLHMLLPANGTGPGSLIQNDIVTGSGNTTKEFTTRWDIIREFASRLDYQVCTSPSGDLVVEFPQYGFTPSIYSSRPKNDPLPNNEGSISRVFIFDRHVKEETMQDEGEDFPTILQTNGGYTSGTTNSAANANSIPGVNLRAFVYSPTLVSRYGVISESADFPFVGQNSNDVAGLAIKRLGLLSMVEYTKRIANSSSWSGSLVYRPLILPNRPIQFVKSARIANIKSVTHTWTIGQTASTSINCNMLMAERWNGKTSSYRLLTGSENTPLDTGTVWNQALDTGRVQNPTSGVMLNTSQKPAAAPAPAGTPDGVAASPRGGGDGGGPAITDLDYLYPPFAKRVKQFFAKLAELNIKVAPTSTYRTPAKQRALNAGKAAGLARTNVGELFLSMHQYGLAVDIAVTKDGNYVADYNDPIFDQINAVQRDQLKLGFVWGGEFPVPAGENQMRDAIHFQIPYAWRMNQFDALIVRQQQVGKPEAQAVKAVWDLLDAKNPGLRDPDSVGLPKIDPTLIAESANSASLEKAKNNSGLFKSLPVSEKQDAALSAATSQAQAQTDNAAGSQPLGTAVDQVNTVPQSDSCAKNELKTPGLK